jgi:hypothetical protein
MAIFGQRGDPVRGGWTSEELATQARLDTSYLNRYISVVIPFAEDMPEPEQLSAFRALVAWSTLSGTPAEVTTICVPGWLDYQRPRTQDLILLAAESKIDTAPVLDEEAGRRSIEPNDQPLDVVYPVPGKPGQLTHVLRSGRVVTDRAALTALLSPSSDLSELTIAFGTALGGLGIPVRDYAAAEELTHRWRSGGSTDADIRRYLETFGFRNSHGNLGRWRDLPKARRGESKIEGAL